jgi:CheY-like chemotaxis protein
MEIGKNLTHCFLIDDDEDDYEIFKMALNDIDPAIRLHYAYNGFDALKKLNGEHHLVPDFIFIDWNMPKMNGRQCLEEIKKNERLRHIPVYIYSTSSDPKAIEETRRLGASDFIVKPSSISTLVNILARIFHIRTYKHT